MKRIRIPYFILMGIFLLMGLVTGLRIWFVFFLAQLTLLLCSAVLCCWTAFSFSYQQTLREKTAVKGGSVTLELSIYNDRSFPLTGMRIHVCGMQEQDEQILDVRLAPHTQKTWKLSFFCPMRGEHTLGVTILEISDLFGLLPMRFPLHKRPYYNPLRVTVYPKVHILSRWQGAHTNQRAESSMRLRLSTDYGSFAGTRRFEPGDALKHVHWKNSARKRELQTRQFETPQQELCLVLLDTSKFPTDKKNRENVEDFLCECAATLTYALLGAGRHLSLAGAEANGTFLTAESLESFSKIQQYLALVPFTSETSASFALQTILQKIPLIRNVFVITDHVDDMLGAVMENAFTMGTESVCLCIGQEALPADRSGVHWVSITEEKNIPQALEGIL